MAIREAIRLDSALGRALINILLVFAQMEREATGSGRARRSSTFGRVAITSARPRMGRRQSRRLTIHACGSLSMMRPSWRSSRSSRRGLRRIGITEMANRLNAAGIAPPQSPRWTKSVIYNLRLRLSHIQPRPSNDRPHSDEELKQRMVDLRKRGHTQAQIAAILNELGFLPFKGAGSRKTVCASCWCAVWRRSF